MKVWGVGSAGSRLAIVTLGLAAVVSTASMAAAQQAPAAAAPAAAPAAAEDPFKFTSNAGYFQFLVKGDKTADFESVWDVIYTRLAAAEKPELKELGGSLRMYRLEKAAGQDQVTYLFLADPASKLSYGISPFLLFESGLFQRAEADEMFKKVSEALAGYGAQPINKLH